MASENDGDDFGGGDDFGDGDDCWNDYGDDGNDGGDEFG